MRPVTCCQGFVISVLDSDDTEQSDLRGGCSDAYGFERASRAYRASLEAVTDLKSLVRQLGIACDMRDRNSLYLAAGDSSDELLEEHRLRQRAGLPGDSSTTPCCSTILESTAPARSRRVSRMPIRCSWRVEC
jgi:hypothetical protein